MLCLGTCGRFCTVEVISATYKSILTCLVEIISKILIYHGSALCSLNNNKTYWIFVYHSIAQCHPINISLIVRNIYALNLVPRRITGIPIKSTPTESCRTYKKIVEYSNIDCYDKKTSQPPFGRNMLPVK